MSLTRELVTANPLPPVVLDARYVERLEGLATAALHRNPSVANRLLDEIERASVLPSAEMPGGVVNIGSRVAFREEGSGRVQQVVLVLPAEADIASGRVSVLTPIGAALIGLAAGASMTWETRDGETRRLTVLEVGAADGPPTAA